MKFGLIERDGKSLIILKDGTIRIKTNTELKDVGKYDHGKKELRIKGGNKENDTIQTYKSVLHRVEKGSRLFVIDSGREYECELRTYNDPVDICEIVRVKIKYEQKKEEKRYKKVIIGNNMFYVGNISQQERGYLNPSVPVLNLKQVSNLVSGNTEIGLKTLEAIAMFNGELIDD